MARDDSCNSNLLLSFFRTILSIMVRVITGSISGAIAGGFVGLVLGILKAV